MRLLLTLLFFAGISRTQPQQQSPPTQGVDASAKKNESRSVAKTAKTRSTASTKVEQKADPEKTTDTSKKETTGPSNDQRLADYTGNLADYTKALAVFTAILIVVGILQFAALFWQGRTLQHHSRSLRRSVIQMRESVRAYRRYVELGENTLELTRESNKTTRDATELTRQSLLLTHRPKLIAVGFYIHGGILRAEQTADGTFSVVNAGGTRATVESIWVTARFDAPPRRPYHGQSGDYVGKVLAPGESMDWKFRKDDGAIPDGAMDSFRRGQLKFYALGFVKYSDEADPPVIRHTFFCRELIMTTGRFKAIEDEDYERCD